MADMFQLIEELWFLKRDLVSDDYDRALARLAEEVPMTIHKVPSGTKAWTWTVPEKWTCREAYLETLDGKRLIDYADHPLHVVSYSLPFEGMVDREELLQHLHVHPRLPDAIPYVFKYYQRDWGLCCTQQSRDSLIEDRYRVVINSEFTPGELQIGEVLVKGEVEDCFVLAAHLDHPAMVNDDLSGVVVGLDVMRSLLAGPKPHFSYRFLLFPETIGSVAYLSQNEKLIPSMKAGLFLEMLGNAAPHALQTSFQPDSAGDRILQAAFQEAEPDGYIGPFRTIIDNDERQFNAPGVRIPMLSLSRTEDPASEETRFRPYREYHSSLDTPAIVAQERLEASRDLVLKLLEAYEEGRGQVTQARPGTSHDPSSLAPNGNEQNRFVVNHFKGEIFAADYPGIWVDYRQDREGHKRRFEIMDRCDGTRTSADIANELNLSVEVVWDTVEIFLGHHLVSLSDVPQPTDPHY
jgi:aminopeptidase-like protein